MSRDINIDLTEPLESADPDDLRYALDRNLFDPEDAARVAAFLAGEEEDEDYEDYDVAEATEEQIEEYNAILNGSVGEVIARIDEADPEVEDIIRIGRLEKANKNRKGVLDYLASLLDEED